jgi:uncharacterized protein (DUF2252 family)
MSEPWIRIRPWQTVEERRDRGRAAREAVPRDSHAEWHPDPSRPNAVGVISAQDATRVDWLVPVRHARMAVSPFSFYRGTAAVMAADLAGTPDSGLWVQAAGDAHLSNFGAYASPSRQLVFDQNDFDETLPGPWEWDLKRLAASFVLAAKNIGMHKKQSRRLAARCVRAYREAMARYAKMDTMELWYETLSVDDFVEWQAMADDELRKRLDRFTVGAKRKTSLQALSKLAERDDEGRLRIRSQHPLLVPLRELPMERDPHEADRAARQAMSDYAATTPDSLQVLLARFDIVDIALKVVGVGSVGTRCFVVLLRGRDDGDPLFLQVKEAGRSVLEPFLRPSSYAHQGQRVVEGQRLIQAQSDIFLGWTTGDEAGWGGDDCGREHYVRQLRDWKGSVDVEQGTPKQLGFYADLCGHTLARGHARSGDPVALAAYMGSSDVLDRAMAEFAMRYSKVARDDYNAFVRAITDGALSISAGKVS